MAIALAWANERELILNGLGSYDWDNVQQENILKNKIIGYVGQWVCDFSLQKDVDASKIQFIYFYTDYLKAHSEKNRNKSYGYFDSDIGLIKPVISVNPVLLSDPAFLGKQNNKSTQIIGTKNKFEICVGASQTENSNSNIKNKEKRKNLYGL